MICSKQCCSLFWRNKSNYTLLLFALIAFFISSGQNLIAPNLTQIQLEFNFTNVERDVNLGGYVSLAYFFSVLIASPIIGYYSSAINRHRAFVVLTLIGNINCLCTYFVFNYAGLITTRAVSGLTTGAFTPLVFSMIGDMFNEQHRGKAISVYQLAFNAGGLIGKIIAGLIGPADALGWKTPYLIMSIPGFILIPLCYFITSEPTKGKMDNGFDENNPAAVMDWHKIKLLAKNKTVLLTYCELTPASMAWAVMLVYFQDFLVQDVGPNVPGGITVQQSTLAVTAFGLSAGVGMVVGGYISDKLWNLRYESVPIVMGICSFLSALPIYGVINGDPLEAYWAYALAAIPTGLLSTVTGIGLRTLLMNVTLPETRGVAFALYGPLGGDVGLGPLWVGYIIAAYNGNRLPAFNVAIGGWCIAAVFLWLITLTIRSDMGKKEAALLAAQEGEKANAKVIATLE